MLAEDYLGEVVSATWRKPTSLPLGSGVGCPRCEPVAMSASTASRREVVGVVDAMAHLADATGQGDVVLDGIDTELSHSKA